MNVFDIFDIVLERIPAEDWWRCSIEPGGVPAGRVFRPCRTFILDIRCANYYVKIEFSRLEVDNLQWNRDTIVAWVETAIAQLKRKAGVE